MAGCSGEFKGDRRYIITSGLTGEHSAAFRTLTAAARLVSRMSSEASDSELSDAEQGAISAEESLSCVPCPRYQNNRGAHLHRSTSSNSGSVLQSESVSAVKDSEVPNAVDVHRPWQSPHQQRLARCRGKVRVNRAWHDAVRACAAHMPGRAARSASVLFLFRGGGIFFLLELELQISTPRSLKKPVQFPR